MKHKCPNCDEVNVFILNNCGQPSCPECGYVDPYLLEKQHERIQKSNRSRGALEVELSALETLRRVVQSKIKSGE